MNTTSLCFCAMATVALCVVITGQNQPVVVQVQKKMAPENRSH